MTCIIPDGKKGFTLVEVLAALIITGIVILAITNLFVFATHNISHARKDTEASLFAQEKLEELMQVKKGSSLLNDGFYSDTPKEGYRREWRIYKDNPAPKARLIVVKVTPQKMRGERPVKYAVVRSH